MKSRRDFFKTGGLIAAAGLLNNCTTSPAPVKSSKKADFSFCLNTSTIRGQNPGLEAYIKIASEVGYDGVELWIRDVRAYLEEGHSAQDLKNFIEDHGLRVENAIGFAPWLVEKTSKGHKGIDIMKEEMELMASIGCLRIAATPAGVPSDEPFDLFRAGRKYHDLIEIGKEIGIMPQLEFWGASPVLYHFAQLVMIAAAANHPDVHLLPDVYHLFRGGSGFEGLKMLSGNVIEIFHMNDFVDSIPRENQQDKDRVYPGDGVAPMHQILGDLSKAGGTKVLSVELFNEEYWKQDPKIVAKTALEKMQRLVQEVESQDHS